jgi:branched-chain amino acid transport system substrate-binding protein
MPRRSVRTRALPVVALVACCWSGAACGSRLSEAELRAQGSLVVSGPQGAAQSQATSGDVGSVPGISQADAEQSGGGARPTSSVAVAPASAAAQGTASGTPRVSPTKGPTRAKVTTSTNTTRPGPADGPATGSVIKLGNVGTYSGVIGAITTGTRETLQSWADYTNDHGGLNGHRVEIIFADDGGDPATSQAKVQALVEQEKVLGFIANMTILTTRAYTPYLEQKHIPVMGGEGSSAVWFTSPVLFPVSAHVDEAIIGDARIAVKAGKKRIALFYCVESDSCGAGKKLLVDDGKANEVGGEIVYQAQISITAPTYTSQCLGAKNAGAESIIILAEGGTVQRVGRDCKAQTYQPLLVTGSGFTASLANDPNVDGMVGLVGTFPWMASTTPAQQLYQQVRQSYTPNVAASSFTSLAWASAQMVKAALVHLPATPTSGDLFKGLWTIKGNDFGGLAPPMTFNASSSAAHQACFYVVKASGGRFVDPNNGKYVC